MPANSGLDQVRDAKGKWKKGASGNPAGPPKGMRHRATKMAQTFLDGEAEALARKVVELALAGDGVALRLALERTVPPRKDRSVSFPMPSLDSPQDAVDAIKALLSAVSMGDLTPSEASQLVKLLDTFVNIHQAIELEQRVAALESDRL